MIGDWITLLFVPGDRTDRYARAAASRADAIALDLEDAVAPARKDFARQALPPLAGLVQPPPIVVRVNAQGTPWHRDDLAALSGPPISAIMLPKAEDVADVGDRPLIALIETPRGLAAARQFAASGPVARLAFGSIDFSVSLGSAHSREALLAARSELVLASALAGIASPVDGVTTTVDDDGSCESDARHAQELGFGSKLCIHPRQVAPARRGFAPSAEELEWARTVLAAGGNGAER